MIKLYVSVLFIYFTDIYDYSLYCTFFDDLYEHFLFYLLGYALLAGEPTICNYRHIIENIYTSYSMAPSHILGEDVSALVL